VAFRPRAAPQVFDANRYYATRSRYTIHIRVLTMDAHMLARLLGKVIRHPDRAIKRIILKLKLVRLDRTQERKRLLAFLTDAFGVDARALYTEYIQSDFAVRCRTRREELAHFSAPHRFGSIDYFGGESLYLVVRVVKPRVIVETGVLYGASSSYILEALAQNGRGELYSIDLGNNPQEPPNDFFVPSHLQNRWHLIIGDSRRELPDLLERLGKIDFFHHDSLHTFEHMMWEYETAFRHLHPQGVLASDDVNLVLSLRASFQRNPFTVFCENHHLRWEAFRNFGVAMCSP
jgi:predicted O-methyltransferase YrrM